MESIIHRVPVNKTAALVTGKGVHYTPPKKHISREDENPIPCKPYPKTSLKENDITGRIQGRLLVIGIAADQFSRPDSGADWVCRCQCGRYCCRKRKALINPRNNEDACEHCRHLMYLQRKEHYKAIGKYKD